MYNRVFKILSFTFMLVGVITLAVMGIIIGAILNFRQGALSAPGEFVYEYPVGYAIKFTAEDDKIYYAPPDYSSTNFKAGRKVTVYYHPENPTNIQIADIIWFSAIPGGIGLIFLSVGSGVGTPVLVRAKRKKRLKETGNQITAQIESVRPNLFIRVNRSPVYNIYCHYSDQKGTHELRSENLLYNPEKALQKQGITALTVYVDRNNPYKRYYVDLSAVSGV